MRWACVIPTWNSQDVVRACCESIRDQIRPFDEVVVVDNGSMDGTHAILTEFTSFQVIRFPENRGFSAAVNTGVRQTSAPGVVWLNADARLDRGFLEAIDAAAEGQPDVGMFAAKILYDADTLQNGAPLIENVGNRLWLDGLNWCVGRGEVDRGQYDIGYTPIFPSGAAFAVRREVMDSVGELDEGFFAYGEDADFGLRAFLLGHRTVLVKDARVWHRLSHSLGRSSREKLHLVERNRTLLVWKHFPLGLLLLSFPLALLRYSLWTARRGRSTRAEPFLQKLGRAGFLRLIASAHRDALRMIRGGSIRHSPPVRSTTEFVRRVGPFVIDPRALLRP